MQEFITLLLEVQKKDLEILELTRQKNQLPKSLADRRREKDETAARFASVNQALIDFQLKKKNLELDIAQRTEMVQKHQSQLLSLKSNKDYRAMDLEIQVLKQKNRDLEDQVLECMVGIEEKTALTNEAKRVLAEAEAKVKGEEQVVEGKVREIEALIQKLAGERKTLASGLDPDVVDRYDRVLANKRGVSVVKVVNDICQGCNMRVTRQTLSTLKKTADIVLCDHCSRILYLQPDPS